MITEDHQITDRQTTGDNMRGEIGFAINQNIAIADAMRQVLSSAVQNGTYGSIGEVPLISNSDNVSKVYHYLKKDVEMTKRFRSYLELLSYPYDPVTTTGVMRVHKVDQFVRSAVEYILANIDQMRFSVGTFLKESLEVATRVLLACSFKDTYIDQTIPTEYRMFMKFPSGLIVDVCHWKQHAHGYTLLKNPTPHQRYTECA